MNGGGILYSFRRCPYAIRSRLALAAADVVVEVREVALRAKPPELLEASARGTVPVLQQSGGAVVDESLPILFWALEQVPQGGAWARALRQEPASALIAECDGPFKHHLDGFRYGSGDREDHRSAALAILRRWNRELESLGASGDRGPSWTKALGWTLLPFVRQFRRTDPEGFAQVKELAELRQWLAAFEAGPELARVLAPPWAFRQAWRSPRWLYHLALEEEWQQARSQGCYERSTRDRSLQEEGFIHASWSHQVEATWRRFYGDGPDLRLLVIDPARLEAAGIPLRVEPAPGSGELFPHIHGPLPIEAVLLAERFTPAPEA